MRLPPAWLFALVWAVVLLSAALLRANCANGFLRGQSGDWQVCSLVGGQTQPR